VSKVKVGPNVEFNGSSLKRKDYDEGFNLAQSIIDKRGNEMSDNVKQQAPGPAQATPFMRMSEQINNLERSLNTMFGWTDESARTRVYVVAQIEAIKWCLKQFDVGE
jgi:hypothetical protein